MVEWWTLVELSSLPPVSSNLKFEYETRMSHKVGPFFNNHHGWNTSLQFWIPDSLPISPSWRHWKTKCSPFEVAASIRYVCYLCHAMKAFQHVPLIFLCCISLLREKSVNAITSLHFRVCATTYLFFFLLSISRASSISEASEEIFSRFQLKIDLNNNRVRNNQTMMSDLTLPGT